MYPFEWTFELRFIVALALGFLVGLERESAGVAVKIRVLAGVRTFTVISMYGFGCAWLFQMQIDYALPVGMASVTALAVVGYLAKLREGRIGWTTEISAVLTFVVGALALLTDIWVPMALGIINTIILSEKADLERYVENLDKSEFLAVLKFLLVTVIVLPALPNEEFTQFNLNPTRIWQIVIMVSTIGFVGYFLTKKFGSRIGLWLSGLLGGIVSSTAVSIAAGRIAQKNPEHSGSALQASILASSVMYIRILVLIWILNPPIVAMLWWKLVILSLFGSAFAFGIRHDEAHLEEAEVSRFQNPFEIRPALLFAAIFVFLTIATVFVKNTFGEAGILALGGIVGVTDIDPFILSLVQGTHPFTEVMSSAILVSMMSNTIVKGIYFGTLSRPMWKQTTVRFGVWAVLHLPVIIWL